MLAHVHPLVVVERAGLEQHRVLDADLADVVQERAELERLEAVDRIAGFLREHERVRGDAAAVALGVRVLRFDRLGEAEQRLPVRRLELLVGLLELLGALLDDDVEQHLAALQLAVIERQLADELALLLDEVQQLDALADERDQAAALLGPGDEADDRALVGRAVVELDGLVGRRHQRDAQGLGRVEDRRLEQADAVERAGVVERRRSRAPADREAC